MTWEGYRSARFESACLVESLCSYLWREKLLSQGHNLKLAPYSALLLAVTEMRFADGR